MAGGGNFVLDKGYVMEGSAAVTAFRFVDFGVGGANYCKAVASVGIKTLGVVQESVDAAKVTTGKAVVDIRLMGISKVVASAAVAYGAEVSTDSVGRAKTAATTERVVGVALSAAAATGDIIDVLLTVVGRVMP